MSYPRENTIQAAIASTSGAAVTLKLPNGSTGVLPGAQVGNAKPIGLSSRWRLRLVTASFSAVPATPSTLTITDGVITYLFDVTGPLILSSIDIQCAAGAEVDITLALAASAIGHINVSAVVEG